LWYKNCGTIHGLASLAAKEETAVPREPGCVPSLDRLVCEAQLASRAGGKGLGLDPGLEAGFESFAVFILTLLRLDTSDSTKKLLALPLRRNVEVAW
jgi:hypothetical protein